MSPSGTVTTVAGTGDPGFSGDGGPATQAKLDDPSSVAPTADGGYLIADRKNNRIRKVTSLGIITTVAGTGTSGFGGDGGPAGEATIDSPRAVAVTADAGYLIADTDNHRIRRVSPEGQISTVMGTGASGFSGDGGPASAAELSEPGGVATTGDGGLLIADTANHRIRRVSPSGIITTAAGTGTAGFSSDGGQAAAAMLNAPGAALALPDGGFLVADTGNHRVREVSACGRVATVAGTDASGYNGDGMGAPQAQLDEPASITLAADGRLLIADTGNNRIRAVTADFRLAPSCEGTGSSTTGTAGSTTGTAGSTTPAPGEPAPTAPAPPRPGATLNAEPARGTITVRVPGSARFVDLEDAASVPVGSVVNAENGAVRLTVSTGRGLATQSAVFHSGAFQVRQVRRPARRGRPSAAAARPLLTELILRGGSFAGCRRPAGRSFASVAAGSRGRRLWGSGKGDFRTRGRNSAATVRGTVWLTEDRCDGTLTRVRRGVVEVRDFGARRTVLVRAGKRYLARASR